MKVDCGAFHTGALNEYGALFTWGKNGRGQLGTGDNLDRNLPYHLEQVRFCFLMNDASCR